MRSKLFIALALTACTTTGSSSTGIDPVSCPTGSTLTYANFGEALLSSACLTCHTSRERPRLTTQALVQANAPMILDVAVYTDAMPQDGTLTIAQRRQLGEWLACGAP